MGRGFTLIEVLISMLILSITFLWLLKAETQGIDMSLRARFITTSTLLAQDRIAQVTSEKGSFMPGNDSGEFGEEYPGYAYTEDIESTALVGYYKYTLTVTWGQGGKFENRFISFLSAD